MPLEIYSLVLHVWELMWAVLGPVGQLGPPNSVIAMRYRTNGSTRGDHRVNYHTDSRVAPGRWCSQVCPRSAVRDRTHAALCAQPHRLPRCAPCHSPNIVAPPTAGGGGAGRAKALPHEKLAS